MNGRNISIPLTTLRGHPSVVGKLSGARSVVQILNAPTVPLYGPLGFGWEGDSEANIPLVRCQPAPNTGDSTQFHYTAGGVELVEVVSVFTSPFDGFCRRWKAG